jgi:hypothetical protein
MKKLMFIAMISFGFMLVGCSASSYEDAPDKDNAWMLHGIDIATKVVEIEGHKYIIMDGYYSGTIIHAESCGCKK